MTRLLLLMAALCAGCAPEAGRVRVDGDRLLDEQGRSLLVRGVNARVQGLFDVTFDDGRAPLQPIPPFAADDCAFLADELGLNLLRLPVNWSALEPEPGQWDAAYRARILEVVRACREADVYTLVDLHQDAYSKEIGEDGAPLWAIVPPPDELLEGPLTDLAERRTSGQVLRAFRSFFDNEEGLQDAFAATAAWLAQPLAGEPGVLGLELFNEPVAFDDDKLDDFHTRVAEAVRAVAPELPLAFEPDALRNFTDSDPVENRVGFDGAIYAPHHYTDVFEGGWLDRDEEALRQGLQNAAAEGAEHGTPVLVGEFGHQPRSSTGRAWLEASLDEMDALRLSWAAWVYEEWSQDSWGLYDPATGPDGGPARGDLREPFADLLARPFPIAVDGELAELSWDGGRLRVELLDAAGTHVFGVGARLWPTSVVATCDGRPVATTRRGGRLEVRGSCSVIELRYDP